MHMNNKRHGFDSLCCQSNNSRNRKVTLFLSQRCSRDNALKIYGLFEKVKESLFLSEKEHNNLIIFLLKVSLMLYTKIKQIYIYYNNCIKLQRIQIRWENYLSDCVVINIFYEVFFIIRCKTLMQQQDLKCVPVSTWPFPHASPVETLHSSGELKDTHAHA